MRARTTCSDRTKRMLDIQSVRATPAEVSALLNLVDGPLRLDALCESVSRAFLLDDDSIHVPFDSSSLVSELIRRRWVVARGGALEASTVRINGSGLRALGWYYHLAWIRRTVWLPAERVDNRSQRIRIRGHQESVMRWCAENCSRFPLARRSEAVDGRVIEVSLNRLRTHVIQPSPIRRPVWEVAITCSRARSRCRLSSAEVGRQEVLRNRWRILTQWVFPRQF